MPKIQESRSPHIEKSLDIQSDMWTHLEKYQEKSTETRNSIMEHLKKKKWFQETSKQLQMQLYELPQLGKENHDGFLKDLASRPEHFGGLEVISMIKFSRGNFMLLPVFKVRRNNDGFEYTYEYVSYRQGRVPGAKGIVFIQKDDKITHFVLLKGYKFATAKLEDDSFGGFMDPNDTHTPTLNETMIRELKEELGISNLILERDYDLGSIAIDPGMTNNTPRLFAAVINGDEAKKITEKPVNPDSLELSASIIVAPISQIPQFIKEVNESFFLACISRAIVYGIIPHDILKSK